MILHSHTGMVVKLTDKTIFRNGKRIGYLPVGFEIERPPKLGEWAFIPYTTGPGGTGRSSHQYVGRIRHVEM